MTMGTISLSNESFCAQRIGVAKLAKMAFDNVDLRPLWHRLMDGVTDDCAGAGTGLDLSVIAQLLGDKKTGLAIQDEVLAYQRLSRSPCAVAKPRLRLLAIAAATDIGGNTPVEFLLEGSDIEVLTLYVVPGRSLPDPLPEHDVAMVVVCDAHETRAALDEIERLVAAWPRPVLNAPAKLKSLDRDRLFPVLQSIAGLEIPTTARLPRCDVERIARGADTKTPLPDADFPLVVRPVDSHAGFGLAKIDAPDHLRRYLSDRPETAFFLSRFVDYSGADGLFRKYRVVGIDGKAFACHMAISDQWNIWYLNAEMTTNAARRAEEAAFMAGFEGGFARRHGRALATMFEAIGLDYVTVDCAETKSGELLVFEADSAAIVHNMDPPDIFPYKPPQMRKIFAAFAEMIDRHARGADARAA